MQRWLPSVLMLLLQRRLRHSWWLVLWRWLRLEAMVSAIGMLPRLHICRWWLHPLLLMLLLWWWPLLLWKRGRRWWLPGGLLLQRWGIVWRCRRRAAIPLEASHVCSIARVSGRPPGLLRRPGPARPRCRCNWRRGWQRLSLWQSGSSRRLIVVPATPVTTAWPAIRALEPRGSRLPDWPRLLLLALRKGGCLQLFQLIQLI